MRKRKTYTRSSTQSSFFGGYNLAIKNIRKNIEQLHSYRYITEETYKYVLSAIEEIRIIPKNKPNNIKICLQKKN